MADNTPINPASAAGDTIRTIQRPASPTNPVANVKTEVVQLDIGGDNNSGTQESLVTQGNPLPVVDPYSQLQLMMMAQELAILSAQNQAAGGGFVPVEIPAFLGQPG